MPGIKARYYAVTIRYDEEDEWVPECDDLLLYAKGQQEIGNGESNYRHYQAFLLFSKQVSMLKAKSYCKPYAHVEASRSEAYEAYVWKEDTRVEGTQFEFGRKPMKRNEPDDWDKVYQSAKEGKFDEIPADIRVRCYHQLKSITKDNMTPQPRPGVEVRCFWGPPHTGKSHAAVQWLGEGYYDKPAMNKWWDGYQGQDAVLIDDFDSQIGYTHLKRWFDHYKCSVETKGGAVPLCATRFAITTNVNPNDWFPDAKRVHVEAVIRRIKTFTEMNVVYVPPPPTAMHVDYDDVMFAFLNQ